MRPAPDGVLRVFKPEAEEEHFGVLRPQGWRKGGQLSEPEVMGYVDTIP